MFSNASIVDSLRILSVDARKKYPRVKEAAERGILIAHSSAASKDNVALVLLPLYLALETRDDKLQVTALAALQKVFSHLSAADTEASTVLLKLEETCQHAVTEAVGLKILQTVVTLLSGPSAAQLTDADLSRALSVCLLLLNAAPSASPLSLSSSGPAQSSASPQQLHNIAWASLRQAVSMVTDRCTADTAPSCAALLRDLCALSCAEPCRWLRTTQPVEVSYALELVAAVVESPALATSPLLLDAVRTDVCPLLHRFLGSTDHAFRATLRLLRVVQHLVQNLHAQLPQETEVLLSKMCRMLGEGPEMTWLHAALLDVCLHLFKKPGFLSALFHEHDAPHLAATAAAAGGAAPSTEHTPLFQNLVRAVGKTAQLSWKWPSDDFEDLSQHVSQRVLDSAAPTAAAHRGRAIRLCAECIESVADALRDAPASIRGAMVACSWPALLGTLSLLLQKCVGRTALCYLSVDSLVSLICTSASVGSACEAPRDAFVNALIKCGSEEDSGPDKQIACVIGLLRASRAAGGLGNNSWFSVLQLLLKTRALAAAGIGAAGSTIQVTGGNNAQFGTSSVGGISSPAPLGASSGSSASSSSSSSSGGSSSAAARVGSAPTNVAAPVMEDEEAFNEDVADAVITGSWPPTPPLKDGDYSDAQRLAGGLRSLCRDSQAMRAEELQTFLGALTRLSATCLTVNQTSTKYDCWPLQRLCEATLWNASRCTAAMWDEVAQHLKQCWSHSVGSVREQGLACTLALATRAAEVEQTLRTPAVRLLNQLGAVGTVDARVTCCKGMERIMRRKGPTLGADGWALVMDSLRTVAMQGKREEVTRAFALVQMAVEEFLTDIPAVGGLPAVLRSLDQFALQDADASASLSVPALVWSIAHHASKNGHVQLWGDILRLLANSAQDKTRDDVRAGGLRTLFKMVEMYGASWSRDVWVDCCEKVVRPLCEALAQRGEEVLAAAPSTPMTLNATPPPAVVQAEAWLSTLSMVASGVIAFPASASMDRTALMVAKRALAATVPASLALQKGFRQSMVQLIVVIKGLLEGESRKDAWQVISAAGGPFSVVLQRALAECRDLTEASAASTSSVSSTSKFSHYFVLCDAIRHWMLAPQHYGGAADVQCACSMLCDVARGLDGALFGDALYRSAGIMYDASSYKPHTVPPLITFVSQAFKCFSDVVAALPQLWLLHGLLASLGVRGLRLVSQSQPVSLLLASDGVPFPQFPADPEPPLTARGDMLRVAAMALSSLPESACPPSALPLWCAVLGCLLQLGAAAPELSSQAMDVFVRVCQKSLPLPVGGSHPRAIMQNLVDVCEHYLLWDSANEASLAQCCTLLATSLQSPLATQALVRICKSSALPTSAPSRALSALIELVPSNPQVAAEVLSFCSGALTLPSPPAHVLDALLKLRLPRSAWSELSHTQRLPADDGRGVTHLLLLFHGLVDAATAAGASVEARTLAAKCLHEAGKSVGLPIVSSEELAQPVNSTVTAQQQPPNQQQQSANQQTQQTKRENKP